MVHVFHHAPHVLLSHSIHAHAIIVPLLRCPVSSNAGVFSTLTIPFPRLIGLLRGTFWLDRSGLGFIRSGCGVRLLGKREAGNKTRGQEQNGS